MTTGITDVEWLDAKVCELSAQIERMKLERRKLDRRIHNQRKAWRDTWDIIEQRAQWRMQPREVRTKMLAAWCECSRERNELRKQLDALEQEESGR